MKNISILLFLCFSTSIAFAMEREKSPSSQPIQKKVLNQALPSDAWKIIAHYLDASTRFFNELARQVNLDKEGYLRLVEVFFARLEKDPDTTELEYLIKKHFSTAKFKDFVQNIRPLIEKHLGSRPIWQWTIEERSLNIFRTIIESIKSRNYNLSIHHLNLVYPNIYACTANNFIYLAKQIAKLSLEQQTEVNHFVNCFLGNLKKTDLLLAKLIAANYNFKTLVGKNITAQRLDNIIFFSFVVTLLAYPTTFLYNKICKTFCKNPDLIQRFTLSCAAFTTALLILETPLYAYHSFSYEQLSNNTARLKWYLQSKYRNALAPFAQNYESNLQVFEKMQASCRQYITFFSKLKFALHRNNEELANILD